MPDLADPTALDRELSPSLAARDAESTLREYRTRGDAARARLPVHEAVPYGDHPAERCHVFPAAEPGTAGTAVLVYVHGGHWQQSGIDEACFAAANVVAQGCAFVALGYGLAPARRLPDMIASVAKGLAWLDEAGPRFGIDRGRVHVAGSSAGAHLLAAALADGAPQVRSACLLSGLYDLSGIPGSYVNDALGLTAETARACSPVRMPPPRCDEVLLAAGEHETSEYLRQQETYATHLRAEGVTVADRVMADRDHFDLPLDLDDPTTELGRTALSLRGLVMAGMAGPPERTVTPS